MGKETPNGGRFLSLLPSSIFLLVAILQLLDGFIARVKKREFRSTEENQIRQEIKQLLKEASLLSTPSTFAQAAKLRRVAAAKEKELFKKQTDFAEVSFNGQKGRAQRSYIASLVHGTVQEVNSREKRVSSDLCARALMITKAITYLGLSWWFWGVPVAVIPQQLLQPFGKVLSWRAGSPATGLITVGIVPWLVLTTRVSKFLCQKLSNFML